MLVGCNNQPYQQTNIEYDCPLCEGTSIYWCADCGKDALIWCKPDNYSISSFSCEYCSAIFYPQNTLCFYCNKQCRSDIKFWTNRNGKNHRDCQEKSKMDWPDNWY